MLLNLQPPQLLSLPRSLFIPVMKKGQIVRVEKEKYLNSVNYLSVEHPPYYKGLDYIYEDRGEVLDLRIFETGEYALVAWVGVPTAPAWLPTEMLIKGVTSLLSLSDPESVGFIILFPIGASTSLVVALVLWFHYGFALDIVPRVSKSTTIMVQICYVRVGDHSGGGFPHAHSVVPDLRSQALLLREDGHHPEIWRGWLFT
ncbi:hypothetical protein GBA52_028857 [Prunus armeniaca]|nr:hypothetical protein GBA52_028857 [Prunus armeniaca]